MIRALAALAFVGGVGVLSAQLSVAQPAPAFEVASIKPNVSGDRASVVRLPPSGTATIVNSPLRAIIRTAYDVRDHQLVGAPE